MDGKYIFALVILGVFFLVILVSFAFLEYSRRKEERLQQWIDERYANKELNKFNYDTVNSDEEFSEQSFQSETNDVGNSDDESKEEVQVTFDDAYGKIDVEGIEEITGNYTGNK